jgi:hypothetical protein
MIGVKSGLATLLKNDFSEMVSTHSLSHRLELAFKDAIKGSPQQQQHEKLLGLLGNVHDFYCNPHKRKHSLLNCFEALEIKGN